MKKSLIAYCFLVLAPCFLFSQKEDFQWLLGGGASDLDSTFRSALLDFGFCPVRMTLRDIQRPFVRSNALICDSTGRLACWSSGKAIYNGNDEPIEGAEDLTPGSFMGGIPANQAMLILPWPGHPGKVFHISGEDIWYWYDGYLSVGCDMLSYTLIDLNANGGAGQTLAFRVQMTGDTVHFANFVAVRHANGRDWWITVQHRNEKKYYQFLLDPTGISLHHVQYIEKSKYGSAQAVYSPDGQWFAHYSSYGINQNADSRTALDLYRFDRCSGQMYSYLNRLFNGEGLPGGVAFSKDSRYLYVSNWEKMYQYDLYAPDILASELLLGEYDGFIDERGYATQFYHGLLAPDGKIYFSVANINSRYLHSIEHPERAGLACGFRQHSVFLPAYNTWVIPNVPNPRLGSLDGSPCDTLGLDNRPFCHWRWELEDSSQLERVTFTDLSAYEPATWHWDFGDGSSASQDTSPVHTFPAPGLYTVCLTVCNPNACDTICKEVAVGLSGAFSPGAAAAGGSVAVFPNPASDYFQLLYELERPGGRFELFDAQGRLLRARRLEGRSGNVIFNIEGLPDGLYFWRARGAEFGIVGAGKLLVR